MASTVFSMRSGQTIWSEPNMMRLGVAGLHQLAQEATELRARLRPSDHPYVHVHLRVLVEESLHLVQEGPACVHDVEPQLGGGAPACPRGEADGRWRRAFSS